MTGYLLWASHRPREDGMSSVVLDVVICPFEIRLVGSSAPPTQKDHLGQLYLHVIDTLICRYGFPCT